MRTKEANPADEKDEQKEPDIMNDYEAKDHLDTIMKAHGIMNDPDKMAKVHKLAGRHMKAITSVQDLKDTYDKKFGSGALKALSPKVPKAPKAQMAAEPSLPLGSKK